MPKLTPSEAREKHAKNLKASIEEIRKGIDRVTVAPGTQAAAKQDKMQTRLNEALSSGKWARRVAATTLEDWKRAAKDKGVSRISGGIDAAASKVESFYSELFPYEESLQGKVKGMSDVTLEDSISRAETWMRGMAQFRRSR